MDLFYSNSSFQEKIQVYSKTKNTIWMRYFQVVWTSFAPDTHPGTSHVVIYVFCLTKIASSELCRGMLLNHFFETFASKIRRIIQNGIRIIARLFPLYNFNLRKKNAFFHWGIYVFQFTIKWCWEKTHHMLDWNKAS